MPYILWSHQVSLGQLPKSTCSSALHSHSSNWYPYQGLLILAICPIRYLIHQICFLRVWFKFHPLGIAALYHILEAASVVDCTTRYDELLLNIMNIACVHYGGFTALLVQKIPMHINHSILTWRGVVVWQRFCEPSPDLGLLIVRVVCVCLCACLDGKSS